MTQPEPRPPATLPVNLQFATSGVRSESRAVVRDQEALEALWREHTGGDETMPPPAIDFRGADAVAYFAGPRSSGGHSVTIVGVHRLGRIAVVHVVVSRPAPGEAVTLAFTYPGALRSVPKLPPVVRFDVIEKTR